MGCHAVSHLLRDTAAGRTGPVTHIGLGTFVDPREQVLVIPASLVSGHVISIELTEWYMFGDCTYCGNRGSLGTVQISHFPPKLALLLFLLLLQVTHKSLSSQQCITAYFVGGYI